MSDVPELPVEPVEEPRRPRAGRIVAAVVAVVAVVGAGVFAVTSLAGDGNSPEDPVRAMFTAVERNDVLGVLEQLEPGERDAVRGPLVELTDELNRIGILDHASLSHLTGYDVHVDDLALDSRMVRDDIANVRITAGRSTYRVNGKELPLGSQLRSKAGNRLGRSSGSSSLKSTSADDEITTVKRDGRWYVSLGYSFAEQARRNAHRAIGDLGAGVPAEGTDTPETAVRDFVTALTKLDVRRLIQLLPPGEMGALHDYANLFIDDAEQAAGSAKGAFTFDIPTLDLAADTSGDHSLVTIEKGTMAVQAGGMSFAYDGRCFDAVVPGQPMQHTCKGDDPAAALQKLGITGVELPTFSFKGKQAKVGFAVVREGGKWYLSPTRTSLEALVAFARLVEPSDVPKFETWMQQFMGVALQRMGQGMSPR